MLPKKGAGVESKQLIDAVNLIAEYIGEHLPEDWSIKMTFDAQEASMILVKPDGDHVADFGDGDRSSIIDACEFATENDANFEDSNG
jgi:hypothetical protein